MIYNNSSAANLTYCGEDLIAFTDRYAQLHPYASLLVCLFGMLANTVNMVVLTRKEMVSPTNSILTGLAFADNVVMVVCLPFIVMSFIPRSHKFRYAWALFMMFYSLSSTIFHTISVYLTVLLAVWRYLSVAHPLYSRSHCTLRRAKLAIASAYVVSPVLCLPIYLTYTIAQDVNERDAYKIWYTRMALDNNLIAVNFWTYGVIAKIIPCVALTVLSWQLIRALVSARKRKEALQGRGADAGGGQSDRTTRMLLAVLFLFLVTEFPHGIVALLSGILGDEFRKQCYSPLGDIFDFCALINGAINFILYCAMSRQFRDTFLKLFKPQMLNTRLPSLL